MSRRFGRNQKRAMRAEVASAKAQAELNAAVARDNAERRAAAQGKVDLLIQELVEISQRLGRYAIAAGVPHNFEADWLERGHGWFRMHVPQPYPSVPSYGADAPTTIQVCDEIMRLLEVEAVLAPMSRDMHCRVTFDNHVIGYAISEHALRKMTAKEFERRVAPEITRLLISELKQTGMLK